MANPHRIYELLLDHASSGRRIEELVIGQVWTVCRAGQMGLAMSPGLPTRTLAWSGSLKGKSIAEIATWIRDWDPHKAVVGLAAINAGLNNQASPPPGETLIPAAPGNGNLTVFEHFLPRLQGQKVVVVGRYPGLERFEQQLDLQVIERNPAGSDLPDPACEYLIPEADWVFLTASSIANKTFPRLAELARNATTVLMGPSLPWLPELHEFGIDYLAGVEIHDPQALWESASQGGGVRIFDQGVRYRVVELSPAFCLEWIRSRIAQTCAEKEQLKQKMSAWYGSGQARRFPDYAQLEFVNNRLSRLDSCFKSLWDKHPALNH